MPTRRALIAVLATAALAAGPARAQVTCELQVPAFNFGSVDVLGALPADRTLGSIDVICRNAGGSDAVLQLRTAVSAGAGGVDTRRRMAGPGGSSLEYNLFRDVNRTQLWRASGDPLVALTVPTNQQARLQLTVYGRLYGPRDARPGDYSDALVATLEF